MMCSNSQVGRLHASEFPVGVGSWLVRHGLQFLDETVAFVKLRPARDDEGRLRLRRTYAFEFSDTGNNRRQGVIVTLGKDLAELQLEPFRIQ